MSKNIEPREVLSYLNELGYTNINAQQLKEFIIDLKKLMKYDERQYSRYNSETGQSTDLPKKGNNCYICDSNEANIFNTLYHQQTVASKAREVLKKDKQISVHITKSQKQHCKCEAHCTHLETATQTVTISKDDVKLNSDSQKADVNEEHSSRRPNSEAASSKSGLKKSKKPKVSFVRPCTAKVNRSDPVALYHHYQEQWKKQKIPGQDNRSDLRWAIREKMMSKPKVDTVRHTGTRKCSSVR